MVRSGVRVTAWGEEESAAWVETDAGERIAARHVVLALGDGFRHHH